MNKETIDEIKACLNGINGVLDDLSKMCSMNGLALLCIERINMHARVIAELLARAEGAAENPVEEAKPKTNSFYEFFGLKLNRYATPGGDVELIGKRDRGDMPAQVYRIMLSRSRDVCPNHATVYCDGVMLFRLYSHVGFSKTEQITVSALHQFLLRKARTCGRHSRGAAEEAK